MFRLRQKALLNIITSSLTLSGVILLLVGLLCPAQAQESAAEPAWLQDTAELSIDPPSTTIDVNSTTKVDVYIENVTDLAEIDFFVVFDPDLLDVVDAVTETTGTQVEIGPFLGDDVNVTTNQVDQDIGEVHVVQQVLSDTVDGDGVLASITFQGQVTGTSAIEFDSDELYLEDGTGAFITATITNGSITIAEEATVTPSPTAEETSTPTHTATPGPTATPKPTNQPTQVPPTATSELEYRRVQIWPARSVGISSGQMDGAPSFVDTQVLPFGIYSLSATEVIEARTYLHFPVELLPLGTEVRHAVLYVYVDSASNSGQATFGTYRVVDPWSETGWRSDPSTWPDLLDLPIAVTDVTLGVEASARLNFTAKLTSPRHQSPLPTPTEPTSTPTPTPSATNTPGPSMTPSSEPSTTPSPQATSTTSPSSTPGTPSPSATPRPTLPAGVVPPFEVGSTEGQWITWDVTALMRAWVKEEVDNHGLALDIVPNSADPSGLLLARLLTANDVNTKPYIIADLVIHPVTPTPVPLLPSAGNPGGWVSISALIFGMALLMLGLAAAAWRGRSR